MGSSRSVNRLAMARSLVMGPKPQIGFGAGSQEFKLFGR